MGTGIDTTTTTTTQDGDQGIVQRFAHLLFDGLEKSKTKGGDDSFQVYVSFLELYHEDLNDLLEPHRDTAEIHPSIREALDGSIYWAGVREEQVHNAEELLG
ncbi:hypothetical protein BDB00DRAFT_243095 [Zychaea mexicana]|uniref:uncharacterized protein n=1 Tax=Zychaea mexicana TaxID=64656 RepID=UPI0022FF2295|nr:uncharacterized protein BDB00DRAFT_243095 [Zychaea mexicana]KAI9495326.1 hypothetical protein BDB00DRAFT_243095 [Zychaea mexicana]